MLTSADSGLLLVAGDGGRHMAAAIRAVAAELEAAGRQVFAADDSDAADGFAPIEAAVKLWHPAKTGQRATSHAVIFGEMRTYEEAHRAVTAAREGAVLAAAWPEDRYKARRLDLDDAYYDTLVVAGVHAAGARDGVFRLGRTLARHEWADPDEATVGEASCALVGVLAMLTLRRPCRTHGDQLGDCWVSAADCGGSSGKVAAAEILSIASPDESAARQWAQMLIGAARRGEPLPPRDMATHARSLVATGKAAETEAARKIPRFAQTA